MDEDFDESFDEEDSNEAHFKQDKAEQASSSTKSSKAKTGIKKLSNNLPTIASPDNSNGYHPAAYQQAQAFTLPTSYPVPSYCQYSPANSNVAYSNQGLYQNTSIPSYSNYPQTNFVNSDYSNFISSQQSIDAYSQSQQQNFMISSNQFSNVNNEYLLNRAYASASNKNAPTSPAATSNSIIQVLSQYQSI